MIYRILADIVMLAHFGFVLFAIVGGVLVWQRRAVMWLHLPAFFWGVLVECAAWTCPLTPLENRLRRLGGEAGYAGGFIEHYVSMILYPENITRGFQITLGVALIAINLLVYSHALFYSRQSAPELPPEKSA